LNSDLVDILGYIDEEPTRCVDDILLFMRWQLFVNLTYVSRLLAKNFFDEVCWIQQIFDGNVHFVQLMQRLPDLANSLFAHQLNISVNSTRSQDNIFCPNLSSIGGVGNLKLGVNGGSPPFKLFKLGHPQFSIPCP